MEYITVKEASEKWNISARRVCVLCSNGRIPGTVKKSKVWMIPANSPKPLDGRKEHCDRIRNPLVLLLNPTYFDYRCDLIPSKEERELCDVQENFLKGNFDEAYEKIHRFILRTENKQYAFIAHVIQEIIAVDCGKEEVNIQTIQNEKVFSADKTENKYEKLIYSLFVGDNKEKSITELFSDPDYPEMMPLIGLFFIKKGINNIIRTDLSGDMAHYEILCRQIEEKERPLISAYCHLYLAVYYNAISHTDLYKYHIDKAVHILLPRKWYLPLAEYSATLDLEFVQEIDPEAYERLTTVSHIVLRSFSKVGVFQQLSVSPQMEQNINIQIAVKLIQGKSIRKIAEELQISQYKVNKHIDDLRAVAGGLSKKEIKKFFIRNFFV